MTGISETGASKGLTLLGARVLYSESLSLSGSLYLTKRSGFLQRRGVIVAEF